MRWIIGIIIANALGSMLFGGGDVQLGSVESPTIETTAFPASTTIVWFTSSTTQKGSVDVEVQTLKPKRNSRDWLKNSY